MTLCRVFRYVESIAKSIETTIFALKTLYIIIRSTISILFRNGFKVAIKCWILIAFMQNLYKIGSLLCRVFMLRMLLYQCFQLITLHNK